MKNLPQWREILRRVRYCAREMLGKAGRRGAWTRRGASFSRERVTTRTRIGVIRIDPFPKKDLDFESFFRQPQTPEAPSQGRDSGVIFIFILQASKTYFYCSTSLGRMGDNRHSTSRRKRSRRQVASDPSSTADEREWLHQC